MSIKRTHSPVVSVINICMSAVYQIPLHSADFYFDDLQFLHDLSDLWTSLF